MRIVLNGALVALSLALVSCSGNARLQDDLALPTNTPPTYDYALAGGDKLRLKVYGEETLDGEYTISGAGLISLPLIGEVQAQGLTPTKLQQKVATLLADGFINDPQVAVQVITARPFFILGEVTRPGEYAFSDGLSVAAAVAKAGGYTYRAKTREVLIRHAGASAASRYLVTDGTMIAPGDVIRVPERWF